nr:MAG TPA: hypothetical protein [Caudoviricetes sp.]
MPQSSSISIEVLVAGINPGTETCWYVSENSVL